METQSNPLFRHESLLVEAAGAHTDETDISNQVPSIMETPKRRPRLRKTDDLRCTRQ